VESNKKPPPKEINLSMRAVRVGETRLNKNVWGRTTVYLQLFGVNISSGLPTSNYKLDMVFIIGSSDWTLPPHHRELAYLSPLTTGLVRVTHREGYKTSQSDKNIKEQKFGLFDLLELILLNLN